jgi:hypothetical protein
MNLPFRAICLVISLVFLGIAAFMTWAPTPYSDGPWYGRLIAVGLFFFVLSEFAQH